MPKAQVIHDTEANTKEQTTQSRKPISKSANKSMKTIHKYALVPKSVQSVLLPKSAKIISAQDQRGVLCLWVEVDTNEEKVNREIFVFGTGHEMPDRPLKHVATAQDMDGFVWHVYEPA